MVFVLAAGGVDAWGQGRPPAAELGDSRLGGLPAEVPAVPGALGLDAYEDDAPPLNIPPVPSFYAVSQPVVGSPATFNATVFDGHGHTQHEFWWDFGDGSPALYGTNLTQVQHTYASTGPRQVRLCVRDADGLVGHATQGVTVYPAGTLQADFVIEKLVDKDLITGAETWVPVGLSASDPIESGLRVRLNGTSSVGTCEFDWFRGSSPIAAGAMVSKSFAGPQQFDLKLTVYNASWTAWHSVTKRVYVKGGMEYAASRNLPIMGSPADVITIGNRLWVTSQNALASADLSEPSAPGPLLQVPIAVVNNIWSLTAFTPEGGAPLLVYVDLGAGVFAYTADPQAPQLVAHIPMSAFQGCTPLVAKCVGRWLFVSTQNAGRLYVFDLSPLAATPVGQPICTGWLAIPVTTATSLVPCPGEGLLLVRSAYQPVACFVEALDDRAPRVIQPPLQLQQATPDYAVAAPGLVAYRDGANTRLVRTATPPSTPPDPMQYPGPVPAASNYLAMTRTRLYLLNPANKTIYKYDITDPAAPYCMTSLQTSLGACAPCFFFDPDGDWGPAPGALYMSRPYGFDVYRP